MMFFIVFKFCSMIFFNFTSDGWTAPPGTTATLARLPRDQSDAGLAPPGRTGRVARPKIKKKLVKPLEWDVLIHENYYKTNAFWHIFDSMTKKLNENQGFLTQPDLVQYLGGLTISKSKNPVFFVIFLWFQIVLARYFYESHRNSWFCTHFIEHHWKCNGFSTIVAPHANYFLACNSPHSAPPKNSIRQPRDSIGAV